MQHTFFHCIGTGGEFYRPSYSLHEKDRKQLRCSVFATNKLSQRIFVWGHALKATLLVTMEQKNNKHSLLLLNLNHRLLTTLCYVYIFVNVHYAATILYTPSFTTVNLLGGQKNAKNKVK